MISIGIAINIKEVFGCVRKMVHLFQGWIKIVARAKANSQSSWYTVFA